MRELNKQDILLLKDTLRVCGDPDVNCAFPTKPLPVTLAPVPCGEIVVPCGEIDVACVEIGVPCAGIDVACGEIDFPCGDIFVTIDVTCGEISGAVRRNDIDTTDRRNESSVVH